MYMRSMATRRQHVATNEMLKDCIACSCARSASTWCWSRPPASARAIPRSSTWSISPVYVMTSEYGAPSQLEKIDMLDFAELVVLNKFDKRGAEDALRDVRKQWKRNRRPSSWPTRKCRSIRPSPASSTIRA
jgi:methylmalonyl-CoA mutase